MTAPHIDLPANLNNEDDEGLNWALLRNAPDPARIVAGSVVVAGTERFWSWVRIRRVDPDGQVHFDQVSEAEARAAPQASRSAFQGHRSGGVAFVHMVELAVELWVDDHQEYEPGVVYAHMRNARRAIDPRPGDYLVVGDDEDPPVSG